MVEANGSKVFGTKTQIIFRDFLIRVGLKNSDAYLIPHYKVRSAIGGVVHGDDEKPIPKVQT